MSGPTPPAEKSTAIEPALIRPKRARMLLIVFSVLFALWIAIMIGMYILTVYPQRYPTSR